MTLYDYKAFDEKDLNSVCQLLREVYDGKKFSAEYLHWQYLQNPVGKVISVNAFYEDELVAHYAVIPQVSSTGELYCLSVNTATSPKHLRKGLFPELAKRTYDLALTRGFSHIVGVANQNSIYSFIKKLSFKEVGHVRVGIEVTAANLKLCSVSPEALAHRLANPNAAYQYYFDGNRRLFHIFTKLFGQYVYLGSSNNEDVISESGMKQLSFRPVYFLHPHYGDQSFLLEVPHSFSPSPWHVIYRNLSNDADLEFSISGIHMDSF